MCFDDVKIHEDIREVLAALSLRKGRAGADAGQSRVRPEGDVGSRSHRRESQREHEEIHRFQQEITRKQLQSTYFARMQLGRMIDKALEERSEEYVARSTRRCATICVASRDNKPIGDKMIMNAAFLLEREREAEFDAAVNRVAKKFVIA